MPRYFLISTFLSLLIFGSLNAAPSPSGDLTPIAEKYVKLILAMGQHDPDYVDAYYGPPEWKAEADKAKKALDAIENEASDLLQQLGKIKPADDEMLRLRREHLVKQLKALVARTQMLRGQKLPFDVESQALYDAVAPKYADAHFEEVVAKLAARIPGEGPLWQRYENWRKPFQIPNDKLETVVGLAIKECRARTLKHVAMPPNESFTVEYVTNKPWGGYNWYKGDFHSLIQVNTDLPTFIDRAIDLAAHEGYPGHHVYNTLLEKALVRDRGWMEFSVYPLFSPQSLIAEGTANFGRELVFTKTEKLKFEKEVLFPAAGLNPRRADEYYEVEEMIRELGYAVPEAARRLVNGDFDENAAIEWLQKYTVNEPARAKKRVDFIRRYRSYVINYSLGEDLVQAYVDKHAGLTSKNDNPTPEEQDKRWKVFGELLASPETPGRFKLSEIHFDDHIGLGKYPALSLAPPNLGRPRKRD